MIAAIRVRGSINVRNDTESTMNLLGLYRVNHLVLLPEEKHVVKMLKKAENYITWGTVNRKTLEKLLENRALLRGNKKPNAEFFKDCGIKSFGELAGGILAGNAKLEKLGIKKVFRLRPPKKGFERKGIKKPFGIGGALGDRGEKINELIARML